MVIEAQGVLDVDFTGSLVLQRAIGELRRRGIDVAMARLESARAMQSANRTGLITALGRDHLFRTVEEAVQGKTGQ